MRMAQPVMAIALLLIGGVLVETHLFASIALILCGLTLVVSVGLNDRRSH